MPHPENLIPAKKGEIRNPNGKPKGTRHVSTWIQQLLNDETFTAQVMDGYKITEYKGAPIKAIIQAQIRLSMSSKDENVRIKATDLLMKHGWGTKQVISGDPDSPLVTKNMTEEEMRERLKQLASEA